MANWKDIFYKSKPWRELRKIIIRRDKYTCQLCGEVIIGIPEVDHIIELTEDNYKNPDISLNPVLLRTLCHDCHDKRHNRFCKKDKDTIVDEDLNIDYTRR